MFEQITIIAPGLLGTSLAQAVKARRLSQRTVIWARRPETRLKCASQPWCDTVTETLEEAVRGSDIVVICTPVEAVQGVVARIAGYVKPGAIVTDVGSTKSLITRHCHVLIPGNAAFVGSHPMAGSEKSGMQYADAELYRKKTCFVTPLVDTDEKAVESLLLFWKALDMEVVTMTPELHDEIVASISHLPHILASVLCTYLASKDSNWRNFAGDGLRDSTRVASGSPGLWKCIIEQNREEIVRAIGGFEDELQAMKTAITNGQVFEILNVLEHGKAYRDRLRPKLGGS